MKKIFLLLLSGVFLLNACNTAKGIAVEGAWVRPAMQGNTSALYFVLQNHSSNADELIGATSEAAEAVEIHESKMEGDIMTMSRVASIPLEPSAKVEFKPGGYHVMLIGLRQDLNVGDEIEVNLQFKNGPDVTVKAKVEDSVGMNMNSMDY